MASTLFAPSPKTPGHGLIHAKLLPPRSFSLQEMQFVYPLKLISSSKPTDDFITVFILSYGGGLVSNDQVNLKVVLEDNVKMCLMTQGLFHRKKNVVTFTLTYRFRQYQGLQASARRYPHISVNGCVSVDRQFTCTSSRPCPAIRFVRLQAASAIPYPKGWNRFSGCS